jgi:hypothetical protein
MLLRINVSLKEYYSKNSDFNFCSDARELHLLTHFGGQLAFE